jgi:hypothetical protein
LNISTRGLVGPGEESLITGFIVTGNDPKTLVLRALGPSLGEAQLSGTLSDPVITLFDASGHMLAMNDNWQDGPDADAIAGDGLAPHQPAEAALRVTLPPASYTAVVTGAGDGTGLALAEAFDVAAGSDSSLGNVSTRGFVGTNENVLISGFIVGEVGSSTVIVRALGPTLSDAGVNNPLLDPTLTVYDMNGTALATNDNWQSTTDVADIENREIAPTDPSEAAIILKLMPGAYTAIESGADGGSGVGLIEIYNLD